MYTIKIGTKFTSVNMDRLLADQWDNSWLNGQKVEFDIEETEWIALDQIVFMFAWIKNLLGRDHSVFVKLPRVDKHNKRLENCLRTLWLRWKIYELFPLKKVNGFYRYEEYFDFTSLGIIDFIRKLDNESNQYDQTSEVQDNNQDQHRIVPFQQVLLSPEELKPREDGFEFIEDDGDDREWLQTRADSLYNLDERIRKFLDKNTSYAPFENRTLSRVVTVELLLNTLQHAFYHDNTMAKQCFLGIALRKSINKESYIIKKQREGKTITSARAEEQIQWIVRKDVENERPYEEQPFFSGGRSQKFENRSYVEFAYIDFGLGIPNTLGKAFDEFQATPKGAEWTKGIENKSRDTKILQYAFELESSRFPYEEDLNIRHFIPRGLYFLSDIVRRHNGMLVARSRKGKIVINYSERNEAGKPSIHYSNNDDSLPDFPGTMISIVFPAKASKDIAIGAVRPLEVVDKSVVKNKDKHYLSVVELYKCARTQAIDRFTHEKSGRVNSSMFHLTLMVLFRLLQSELNKNKGVHYLDFSGYHDEIVAGKIFCFLCNTPYIHEENRVIVFNANMRELLKDVQQILMNDPVFLYRPIPCYVTPDEIIWIGIKYTSDEQKLNELMKGEQLDISTKDLACTPHDLMGNLVRIHWVEPGVRGNITVDLPFEVKQHKEYMFSYLPEKEVTRLIIEGYESTDGTVTTLLNNDSNYIFLTAGGYYQYEFVNLIELLYDEYSARRFGFYLLNKFSLQLGIDLPSVDYVITVTLSSQLLAKTVLDEYIRLKIENVKSVKLPKLIRLANYHCFEREAAFKTLEGGKKILIVNDMIATGRLNRRIVDSLVRSKGAEIVGFMTIIDSTVPDPSEAEIAPYNNPKVHDKTVFLAKYPIRKFDSNPDPDRVVKRINPILNSPDTASVAESIVEKTLFPFSSTIGSSEKQFLDLIDSKFLVFGHLDHHTIHNSYYFKNWKLYDEKDLAKLLYVLIQKAKTYLGSHKPYQPDFDVVLYPLFSGLEKFGKRNIRRVIENQKARVFGLPRVYTERGWRFPLPPESLRKHCEGKSVLIIDDGTWTGDSLRQIVDSVCLMDVKQLTFVSLLSRIEDFDREFFSRISSTLVRCKPSLDQPSESKSIPTAVFFGTHFHAIPFIPGKANCPLCAQTKLLEKTISDNEVPDTVKKHASYLNENLRVWSDDGLDLAQIPQRFEFILRSNIGSDVLKKLFKLRDRLGKIDGYRLYQEYLDAIGDESVEELEMYMVILLHEPTLLDTVQNLTPVLHANLKRYIHSLISLSKEVNATSHFEWPKIELYAFLFLIDQTILLEKNKLAMLVESAKDDPRNLDCISFHLWKLFAGDEISNALPEQVIDVASQLWRGIESKTEEYPHPYFYRLRELITYFTSKSGSSHQTIFGAYRTLRSFYIREEALGAAHTEIVRELHATIYALGDSPKQSTIRFSRFIQLFDQYLFCIQSVANFQEEVSRSNYIDIFLEAGKPIWGELVDIDKILMNNEKLDLGDVARSKLVERLRHVEEQFISSRGRLGIYFSSFGCKMLEVWKKSIQDLLGEKEWISNLNTEQLDSLRCLKKCLIHPLILEKCFDELVANAKKYSRKPLSWNYDYFEDEYWAVFEITQNSPRIQTDHKGIGYSKLPKWLSLFGGSIDYSSPDGNYVIRITLPVESIVQKEPRKNEL